MAFRYIGTSTTTITNEGTENPTINGIVVTTKTEGDIVFYQTGRYVWLDSMWNYQGDLHTHADVQSALNEIAEAYKGEEVRGSIYDAIALIDTRSAAMEDTIGANITSMVEPIVDRKISTFILDYETSVGNVAQCNLTYEQLRTKLMSNLKAIVHVNGYECDCYIDVQSDYIDVYATSDPMKNNVDTRGTIYYKFNHNNESVTVIYEQSAKKYQEQLTAGPNIIINGNEISAVGGANAIGIEFHIDTNTTYHRDEITINKTWAEVELYMDAAYDGDWTDYDLWHEIQKDCVLKDLRDYPDFGIYPLIGVKYCDYSQSDPVLIFSSRTISNGYPQNNVHYISFIWPRASWTDQEIETDTIDEFDGNSGGGGGSYTNGDGIDITNNEISVKLRSSNPGLAFDANGNLYATGGGGGTTYTEGNGITIDSNNEISTFVVKIFNMNLNNAPTINHTYQEISNEIDGALGEIPVYLWHNDDSHNFTSAIGSCVKTNGYIFFKFFTGDETHYEFREYQLTSGDVLTLESRTTKTIQAKLTSTNAGTGISITTDGQGNPVISLDLPQAEGGGF